VVPLDKPRGSGHAQQRACVATGTALAPVPRRLPNALRRAGAGEGEVQDEGEEEGAE
jgi:hypothetical protein